MHKYLKPKFAPKSHINRQFFMSFLSRPPRSIIPTNATQFALLTSYLMSVEQGAAMPALPSPPTVKWNTVSKTTKKQSFDKTSPLDYIFFSPP